MIVVKTRAARLALDKYFQPGGDVEAELLGLTTLTGIKLSPHSDKITADPELSQSQSSIESIEIATPPETSEMSHLSALRSLFSTLTPTLIFYFTACQLLEALILARLVRAWLPGTVLSTKRAPLDLKGKR